MNKEEEATLNTQLAAWISETIQRHPDKGGYLIQDLHHIGGDHRLGVMQIKLAIVKACAAHDILIEFDAVRQNQLLGIKFRKVAEYV